MSDICVRISPYKLTWKEAEEKCKSEGAHLLHIMAVEVQKDLISLIKKKETMKSYFEEGTWSTGELEGYWTGGMVSILQHFHDKYKNTMITLVLETAPIPTTPAKLKAKH